MRSKIIKSVGTLALAMGMFSSTALANPEHWTNPSPWSGLYQWSKPYSGALQLIWTSTPGEFQAALVDMYYQPEQAIMWQSATDYHPTFDIKENGAAGHMDPTGFANSNLPDPKYDFEDGNFDGYEEEVEVVAKVPEDMSPFPQKYKFETYWTMINHNYNDYIIAYSALSNPPICGSCDYNNIPSSDYSLAGVWKNDILTSGTSLVAPSEINQYNDESMNGNLNVQVQNKIHGDNFKKTNTEYRNIKSKADLDIFKSNADRIFQETLESGTNNDVGFTITFNKELSLTEFKEILGTSQFDDMIIYSRSTDKDGNRFTQGMKSLEDNILKHLESNSDLTFKGFIQIEGKGKLEELKKLKTQGTVYAIEIETEEYAPMGLYWKLESYKNQ